MSTQPLPAYTFDDYLADERAAEAVPSGLKHEYLAGQAFAMAGASLVHNIIAANVARVLGNRLIDKPCLVVSADLKVRIEAIDACHYPDVMVLCGPPSTYDGRNDVVTNPSVVVEVLSPSTEGYDRGAKFEGYRTLESLRHYVLIAQDRLSIDVYSRAADGRWVLDSANRPDGRINLTAVGCDLAVADIYAKVPDIRPSLGEPSEQSP
jgi:Uma2 family endonuclease